MSEKERKVNARERQMEGHFPFYELPRGHFIITSCSIPDDAPGCPMQCRLPALDDFNLEFYLGLPSCL